MLPAATELSYAVADAVNQIIPELEKSLYALASASGWPENVIRSLSIQFDGEDIIVTFPPEMEEEVNDLEYGTLNNLPNAVIRPFILRSDAIVESVLSSTTIDDLIEMEEVF